eukprot:128421_1
MALICDIEYEPVPQSWKYEIDHIAIKCTDQETLEASIKFYSDVLDVTFVNLEEFREEKDTILSFRLTPRQIIDLFPAWKFGMDSSQGGKIDHFCLSTSGDNMLGVLNNLKDFGMKVERILEKASGARGLAFSAYFLDPNGVRIEMRTYDKDAWESLREKSLELMGSK